MTDKRESGMETGLIPVNGATIEYFSQGEGQAVVLLPGGSLDVGYMEDLAMTLAEAGYRAVRVNFRGAGRSAGPSDGISLHTLAADVAGVIEVLHLAPAHVAGHAFGNRIARILAADHPDLVSSVILFAAGGKIPPAPRAAQALATIFNPTSSEAEILAAMPFMVGNPADVARVWRHLEHGRAPLAAAVQRTALAATPLEDWWAPPGQIKYLVLQGQNDQVAPPENGQLLKQELGERVRLVLVPGAGHLLLVEQPRQVTDVVVAFLHQLSTSSA